MSLLIEAVKGWLRRERSNPSESEADTTAQTPSPELRGIPSEEDQRLIKDIVNKLSTVHTINIRPKRVWRPTYGWWQVFHDVSIISFTPEEYQIVRELERRAVLADRQARHKKPERLTFIAQENGPDGIHVGYEDFYFPLIYPDKFGSIDARETFRKLFYGQEVDLSLHAPKDSNAVRFCIDSNMQFLRDVTHLPIALVNVGSEQNPMYSLPKTFFGLLEVVSVAEIRNSSAGEPVSIYQ
ncbi:hypothetical protein HYT17_03265 [Candidatus Microgenomates bacterium]|nr:hypothetical protein [Candidatus Microgenomates bacterium]